MTGVSAIAKLFFPILFIFALFVLTSAGSLAEEQITGAFTHVDRLDSHLKRGMSKKPDVLLVLGEPSGSGSAVIPTDPILREIWYYEDIKVGIVSLEQKQQILLIFFKGEQYDGYMWFSNTVDVNLE